MASQAPLIRKTLLANVGSITANGANLNTVGSTIFTALSSMTFTPNTAAYVQSILQRYFDPVGMSLPLDPVVQVLDQNQQGIRVMTDEVGIA